MFYAHVPLIFRANTLLLWNKACAGPVLGMLIPAASHPEGWRGKANVVHGDTGHGVSPQAEPGVAQHRVQGTSCISHESVYVQVKYLFDTHDELESAMPTTQEESEGLSRAI